MREEDHSRERKTTLSVSPYIQRGGEREEGRERGREEDHIRERKTTLEGERIYESEKDHIRV